jgi:hypothetical protein
MGTMGIGNQRHMKHDMKREENICGSVYLNNVGVPG